MGNCHLIIAILKKKMLVPMSAKVLQDELSFQRLNEASFQRLNEESSPNKLLKISSHALYQRGSTTGEVVLEGFIGLKDSKVEEASQTTN